MNENHTTKNATKSNSHMVKLPGFISEDVIGLGDVVKIATYAMGIKPCTGCERRAEILNRWMVFTR
jgi:hypothetical protein